MPLPGLIPNLLRRLILAGPRLFVLCSALFLALPGAAWAVTGTGTTSHAGPAPNNHMRQGGTGTVTFTLVNNGPGPTSGTMTVSITLPAGLTLGTVPTGAPWNCVATLSTSAFCTNTSAIAEGASYQALTIPVNVAGSAPPFVVVSGAVFSGAGMTTGTFASDTITIDPAPILSLKVSHTDTFTQGSTATWNLQVTNASSTPSGATDGSTVTVVDTLPAGYTLASSAGTDWSCSAVGQTVTCTSTDVVAGNGGQFPMIALTVNVPTNSAISVTNSATAFGGGDLTHTNLANGATGSDTAAVVQVPASIGLTAGDKQTAVHNTAFPTNFSVTVLDAGNNPINGVSVTFAAPVLSASGKFANNTNTTSATTNASGAATATTYTANSIAGSYHVRVTAGSLTNNFAVGNLAGPATQMTANAGTTPQSANINTAFATSLGVTVKDAVNNPVSGVTVTFSASFIGPSGRFPGPSATAEVNTDGSGAATAPVFTANGKAGGPYNVTATASGLPTASFSLTNTGSVPVITTNPVDATVNVGGTAVFTASASGSPTPTVQWRSSTDDGATFQNIVGATTTTLTVSNAAASQNGTEFQAVFTNVSGTATTTAATLFVPSGITEVEKLGDGSVRVSFSFPGLPGRTYRVQSTDSLAAPVSWSDRATGTVDAQGNFEFTDPPPLPGSRFYRAVFP